MATTSAFDKEVNRHADASEKAVVTGGAFIEPRPRTAKQLLPIVEAALAVAPDDLRDELQLLLDHQRAVAPLTPKEKEAYLQTIDARQRRILMDANVAFNGWLKGVIAAELERRRVEIPPARPSGSPPPGFGGGFRSVANAIE